MILIGIVLMALPYFVRYWAAEHISATAAKLCLLGISQI
jgi:hypothetical protein